MALIMLRCNLFLYLFYKRVYCKWMLNLSNTFSESFEDMIFTFILFIWCITLINLWMSNYPCILATNITWSWCMILLVYSQIQFSNILLTIFSPVFIRVLAHNFLFSWCPYLALVSDWCWLHKMNLEVFFSSVFGRVWEGSTTTYCYIGDEISAVNFEWHK